MNSRDSLSNSFHNTSSFTSLNNPALRNAGPPPSSSPAVQPAQNPPRPEGIHAVSSLTQAESIRSAQTPQRLETKQRFTDLALYLEKGHPRENAFIHPTTQDIKDFLGCRFSLVYSKGTKGELHPDDARFFLGMLQAAYLEQECIEQYSGLGNPESYLDLDNPESKSFWQSHFIHWNSAFERGIDALFPKLSQKFPDQKLLKLNLNDNEYKQFTLAALGMREELPYVFRQICIDTLTDGYQGWIVPNTSIRFLTEGKVLKQSCFDPYFWDLVNPSTTSVQRNASKAMIKGELEALQKDSIERRVTEFLSFYDLPRDVYCMILRRLVFAYKNQPIRLKNFILSEESKKSLYFVYWQKIALKLCQEHAPETPFFKNVKDALIKNVILAEDRMRVREGVHNIILTEEINKIEKDLPENQRRARAERSSSKPQLTLEARKYCLFNSQHQVLGFAKNQTGNWYALEQFGGFYKWLDDLFEFYKLCPGDELKLEDFEVFIGNGRYVVSNDPSFLKKTGIPSYRDCVMQCLKEAMNTREDFKNNTCPPGYSFLKKIVQDHKMTNSQWNIKMMGSGCIIIKEIHPEPQASNALFKEQCSLDNSIANSSTKPEEIQDAECYLMEESLNRFWVSAYPPAPILDNPHRIPGNDKKNELKTIIYDILDKLEKNPNQALTDANVASLNTAIMMDIDARDSVVQLFNPEEKKELSRKLYAIIRVRESIAQYLKDIIAANAGEIEIPILLAQNPLDVSDDIKGLQGIKEPDHLFRALVKAMASRREGTLPMKDQDIVYIETAFATLRNSSLNDAAKGHLNWQMEQLEKKIQQMKAIPVAVIPVEKKVEAIREDIKELQDKIDEDTFGAFRNLLNRRIYNKQKLNASELKAIQNMIKPLKDKGDIDQDAERYLLRKLNELQELP